MGANEVEPAILDWYTNVEDEGARLMRSPHNRVERERTRELIGRLLGDGSLQVIDVGGATGVHAGWLAELGHRVTLVDPVPSHVETAGELDGVAAVLGDARALAFAEDSFEVGLALGPLYHLASRDDRVLALRELARVVRPGGGLMAAAIGRYSFLAEFVLAGDFRGDTAQGLVRVHRTGENPDGPGFPLRHSHLADELHDEARDAGWCDVVTLGIEGPLGVAVNLVPPERADEVVAQACDLARYLEADPRAMDLSPHLGVLGRVA